MFAYRSTLNVAEYLRDHVGPDGDLTPEAIGLIPPAKRSGLAVRALSRQARTDTPESVLMFAIVAQAAHDLSNPAYRLDAITFFERGRHQPFSSLVGLDAAFVVRMLVRVQLMPELPSWAVEDVAQPPEAEPLPRKVGARTAA